MRVFADALGLTAEGEQLRPRLREAVSARDYWAIVDNCEHVAPSATVLLADLLSYTQRLRILATSRTRLHIAGEVLFELMPFAVPDADWNPVQLVNSPCGRLFVDRAASQVRAFSPAEILALLDEQLTASRQVDHSITRRHQTLREALQWSYDLLTEKERQLFERCSVFPGLFGYDEVLETLCYPPLQPPEMAELTSGLVDASLISVRRDGEHTEYRMLDSVRRLAFSLLEQRGESDFLQGHYARQLLHRGASMLQDLQGTDQIYALRWYNEHWIDVRSCMGWALKNGSDELAWEFLAGIGTGWEILGAKGELFDWLKVLLTRPLPQGILGVRAEIAATVLFDYQDSEQTLMHAQRAHSLAAELGDRSSTAQAEWALGWALKRADPASATEHLLKADQLFHRLGDEWHGALVLESLGYAEPDTDIAVELLTNSAKAFRSLGDYVKEANCLNQMANHTICTGQRTHEARQWLREAERLAHRTGNRHEQLHAELFRIRLDQFQKPKTVHGARLDQLLKDFKLIGDQRCTGRALLSLGYESLKSGNFQSASRQLKESVALAASCGATLETATGIHLLAESSFRSGRGETAAAGAGGPLTPAPQDPGPLKRATSGTVRSGGRPGSSPSSGRSDSIAALCRRRKPHGPCHRTPGTLRRSGHGRACGCVWCL
ncbi:putative ATPase [Arthrobacter sp. B3I9]|nr:putative ATPase [Arthrobacter sp. B3I9]